MYILLVLLTYVYHDTRFREYNVIQMFISNCNITLHVSDAFCVHTQEHLKIVVAASGV